MKNITFSAQEEAIEKARQEATKKHKTLNELFREWLNEFDYQSTDSDTKQKLESLWEQTSYFRVGQKLSRDELHER
jgi:hypothetical protein